MRSLCEMGSRSFAGSRLLRFGTARAVALRVEESHRDLVTDAMAGCLIQARFWLERGQFTAEQKDQTFSTAFDAL
jgi:hypothetical protein